MNITIGYEVRETRQLTATIVDETWLPETLVDGLKVGLLRFNDDRTAIIRNEHPSTSVAHVVAEINSDEALCGSDYNLPRDFSLEDEG